MPIDSDGDSSDTVQKSNYPSSTNPLTRFHLQKAMPPASTRKNGRSSGSIAWFAIYNSIISRVTSAQLRGRCISRIRLLRAPSTRGSLNSLYNSSVQACRSCREAWKTSPSPASFKEVLSEARQYLPRSSASADRQAPTLCLRRKNRENAVLVKP